MTAEYQVHGDIAVITLNNPPVNGLGYDTRIGITDGLEQANADAAVKAIVITGAGKAFRAAPTSASSARPRPCRSPTCCR
jgi:3-hydroxyacyl-CoA dehydrogenase